MRTARLFAVAALLFALPVCIYSQPDKTIQRIEIGEKIPANIWAMIPKKPNTQMVILDFWDISCGDCIAAFPYLDSLQVEFGDRIQINSVTQDSRKMVDHYKKVFAERHQQLLWPHLYYMTDDRILASCFPYRMVPQHVWIDKSGVVRAITEDWNTSRKNIAAFLSGNIPKVKEKRDLMDFDYEKPFFTRDGLPVNQLEHFSMLIRGELPLASGNEFRTKGRIVYGRLLYNKGIMDLYMVTAIDLLKGFNAYNQLILESVDSSKLFENWMNLDEWMRKYYYSYEISVPVSMADSLYSFMLADLNRYTGYFGRIEQRKVKCLSLIRTDSADRLMSKGGEPENHLFFEDSRYLTNKPIDVLVSELNDNQNRKIPVVNETGYAAMIDIKFQGNFDNVDLIRKQLQGYGLDLVENERVIPMFVLSEKKQN